MISYIWNEGDLFSLSLLPSFFLFLSILTLTDTHTISLPYNTTQRCKHVESCPPLKEVTTSSYLHCHLTFTHRILHLYLSFHLSRKKKCQLKQYSVNKRSKTSLNNKKKYWHVMEMLNYPCTSTALINTDHMIFYTEGPVKNTLQKKLYEKLY